MYKPKSTQNQNLLWNLLSKPNCTISTSTPPPSNRNCNSPGKSSVAVEPPSPPNHHHPGSYHMTSHTVINTSRIFRWRRDRQEDSSISFNQTDINDYANLLTVIKRFMCYVRTTRVFFNSYGSFANRWYTYINSDFKWGCFSSEEAMLLCEV